MPPAGSCRNLLVPSGSCRFLPVPVRLQPVPNFLPFKSLARTIGYGLKLGGNSDADNVLELALDGAQVLSPLGMLLGMLLGAKQSKICT